MWVFLRNQVKTVMRMLILLLLAIEAVGTSLYAMANTVNYNVSLNGYCNFITPLSILFCPEGADVTVTGIQFSTQPVQTSIRMRCNCNLFITFRIS